MQTSSSQGWFSVALLFIMLISSAHASEKPRYRQLRLYDRGAVLPLLGSRGYDLPINPQHRSFGTPVRFSAAAPSPGTQVGETTYDYQHNGSTGRQVDELAGLVQVTWMHQDISGEVRQVRWNSVLVTGSPYTLTLANGDTVRVLPLGTPGAGDGVEVAQTMVQRPGYTNLRNLPSGKGVLFFHDAPAPNPDTAWNFWLAAIDFTNGQGVFNPNPAPQPADSVLGSEVIWPKGCVDVVDGDTVLHVVATGSTDNNVSVSDPVYYWRGVVSGASASWNWAGAPVLIDRVTTMSVIVEADPNSDRVAIVYAKPRNLESQADNDVVYRLSTDGGLTWPLPEVNITNYNDSSEYRAYTDLDAMYDANGTLHIIYNTRYIDWSEGGTIKVPHTLWHWNDLRMSSRVIATADWTVGCSDQLQGDGSYGAWNLLIAKQSLAIKPAGVHGNPDEVLYATWAQYGPAEDTVIIGDDTLIGDCATVDSVAEHTRGIPNTELWCSASSDDGLTWDRPKNITGTVTPDCLPGDCHSEHWVTAAAWADSGVYLSYVDDTHAGGVVQPNEGVLSVSPYMVYALESREPVPEPRIMVVPTRILELNVAPEGTNSTKIEVRNLGNQMLVYDAVVANDNGGASHVLVEGMLSHHGEITAGGKADTLTVDFNGLGLANRTEHDWRIEVACNDTAASPVDILLNVFVADPWFACTSDTISTGLHRLAFSSCLKMGEQARPKGGMYDYVDSTEWLYSASPIIVKRDQAGVTRHLYRDLFWNSIEERSRDSNRAFRAQSAITVVPDTLFEFKDINYAGTMAYGLASSTDSTLLIDWEIRAFKSIGAPSELTSGALAFYTVRPGPVADELEGYLDLGSGFDPDIDSSISANDGMANDQLQFLCGRGGYFEISTSDSIFCPQQRYAAMFYLPLDATCSDYASGGQFLDNKVYVQAGHRGAFHDDSLYNWMTHNLIGWNNATFPEDSLTDGATDVCGLIKDRTVPWTGSETYRFGFGVAVSDISEQDLEDQVRMLRHAANPACAPVCAVMMTGDVNLSSTITSADIIATVNYVFKGGTMPQPCEAAGDATCDAKVTSADIIYLVNHVFKGGDPPCNGCGTTLGWGC